MKLNQRLKQAGVTPVPDGPTSAERAPLRGPAERPHPRNGAGADPRLAADPLAAIKQRAQESLFARLGGRLFQADMTEEQLHRLVIEELGSVLQADRAPLSPAERQQLTTLLEKVLAGLTCGRWGSRRICRLCDYPTCSRPFCPVDHAATRQEQAGPSGAGT